VPPHSPSHHEHPSTQPTQCMSEDDIKRVVEALTDIHQILQNAAPGDKASIYSGLGLRPTYQPVQQVVRAEV